MFYFAKILLAHSKESCSVKLCIATNIVVCMWMKRFSGPVVPNFFGIVSGFKIYSFRIPILRFAFYKISSFEDEDLFARGRKLSCECSAAGACPDNNHVVMSVRHMDSYFF